MKLHPAGLGRTKISVCGWQHSNRDSVRTPNGGKSSRPRKKKEQKIRRKSDYGVFPGFFLRDMDGWVYSIFWGVYQYPLFNSCPNNFAGINWRLLGLFVFFPLARWYDSNNNKTIKKPRRFSTWVVIFKYDVDVLPIWPTYLWESPNLWSSHWSPRGQRYSYWERARFRNQLVFDYTRWWS